MNIDLWILTFSALTVIATIWMGFWSAKRSKTASDFFVAGRNVSVGWNASAISGEYLSAASLMGVAGMVMSSGYDALWYPVCYACGYLFLLLFIAGPLRRFGAYTIPDFAEGRFDSPLFRKIAVVFVLFIGFFYTMPQMKGAGTTLAYIFPGLPYWAGVVITLNVALGGMKGITLVQAFQYWIKMFAISVPIFVLMAMYGHYGKQLDENLTKQPTWQPTADVQKMGISTNSAGSSQIKRIIEGAFSKSTTYISSTVNVRDLMDTYGYLSDRDVAVIATEARLSTPVLIPTNHFGGRSGARLARSILQSAGFIMVDESSGNALFGDTNLLQLTVAVSSRKPLPEKAPADSTWLSPFGPLTTKAAKALKPEVSYAGPLVTIDYGSPLNNLLNLPLARLQGERFDRSQSILIPQTNHSAFELVLHSTMEQQYSHTLSQIRYNPELTNLWIVWPHDRAFKAGDLRDEIIAVLKTNGVTVVESGAAAGQVVTAFLTKDTVIKPVNIKPYALLYTYSLIIALVCGTAGLPHILVRFYTNPDGVAAKRTTMWVMILIGVFYLFPPVFGVMGRNLMPELYNGLAGVKGTDGVVLKLPRILNQKAEGGFPRRGEGSEGATTTSPSSPPSQPSLTSRDNSSQGIPWGSILSGITCAGAFAAFMSTFSGLLVSLTGALAHDVYGRIFRPKSTPGQRMRMFKVCAVVCGSGAILLGLFVEKFEINKMVGWAFAIAATSYFPLLFLSTWWRGITMKGAATGMLAGGTLSLIAITSTMFADQTAWARGLADFYASHPLLRILAEQPAIWALPLAITLMVIVSKLTRAEVPLDIRMKMLVLHAPEKLGLKQEYIQEHQPGH